MTRESLQTFLAQHKASWAVIVLSCGLAMPADLQSLQASDDSGYRDRPLVEVLRELQDRGLDLVFSSAVVGEELRVSIEPTATEPREVLEQILPPLGLMAEAGPAGSILILPAHPAGALRGRILSVVGGRPINGATVQLPETGDSTVSTTDGSFEILELPIGTYEVVVEALGFWTATFARVRVAAKNDPELIVELRAQPAFVTELVVTPNRHSVVRQELASRHTVTHEEAVLVPTIGGDISRVVELLPGVAAADNSAAFNVRGSVAQDVSMVLDGLELYDPFHLQSFQSPFSLIDSNIVDRIDFFGGGFTADLGDRHGGFIDISTLDPEDLRHGEIELGTLNSRFSYRAPLSNGKGNWLVSARGWYPDSVRDTTELGASEALEPKFGDTYFKASFNVARRHILSTHGLVSYDRINFEEKGEDVNEEVDALTRNWYGWFRLVSAWSPKVTTETIFSGGRIDRIRDGRAVVDVTEDEEEEINVDDDRTVDFFGLKHDATWELSNSQVFKTGLDVRLLDARYRYSRLHAVSLSDDVVTNLDPDGTSFGIYAAHRARLTPELAVELGARWDRQTYTNDNQLSPRLNAVWKPGERTELRLALGRFTQSQRIHELHVEDGETEFGSAEAAEQVELSFSQGLRGGMRVRIDAYYRKLTKLRPRYENLFEPIELFPETTVDRVTIAPEEARLQGVELLLRTDVNRPLFWWFSYALSSADDIIHGDRVPRSWDQTHAGKFLIGYRRDERWSVSLTGSLHSGWPTTPVTGAFDTSGEIVPDVGDRNSDHFFKYARLDLKARRSFDLSRGRLWLTLEVVNLTDRDNACCIDEFEFEELPSGGIRTTRLLEYWIGISPSFSVLWEF